MDGYIADYLVAVLAIGGMLIGWLVVQRAARAFALRHPEFGPPREEGGGCGGKCTCKGDKRDRACKKNRL